MLRIITLLAVWLLVSRKGNKNSPKASHKDSESKHKKKNAPAKSYEDYDHATDAAHNTAEQFNWARQNRLTFLTTVFAASAVVLTGLTFYETRRQADAADRQTTIASDTLRKTQRAFIIVSEWKIEKGDISSGIDVLTPVIKIVGVLPL